MAEKNDNSDESFKQEEGLKRFDDSSLINCLEYSTNYLSQVKTNILQLWYMIGTQGPGILLEDL